MMLTVVLVILVIFVFLRTLWATVIPSLAVPLSLLATFAVMYGLGYSLDNISLMGLTISVGFIVDDAIVMIENIVRYLEEGERPFEAALKGAGQIGFTIISITFSLIAVFIPLLFMGGIIGRLFREFAVDRLGRGAGLGLHLADADPGVVLAVSEGAERASARAGSAAAAERCFKAVLRAYDRGFDFVLRHQFPTLVGDAAADGRDRLSLRHDPQGLFPAAGHRLHLRPGGGAAGHLVRQNARHRASTSA